MTSDDNPSPGSPTDGHADPAAPPDEQAQEHSILLRQLRPGDYAEIREVMAHPKVYGRMDGPWSEPQFRSMLDAFPEGQIGVEDNGRLVGAVLSAIVDYDSFGDHHTYTQITGNGYLTTHDPDGDVLYGVDVFVHPNFRGLRLGRRLYDARKELCRKLNLRAIVAGGRIPGYHEVADEMSPDRYIELVKRKELRDPILSFQLANDFHVRRVITDYLPEDTESRGYATIVQWDNIFYQERKQPLIGGARRQVRVGTVQWQMRPVADLADLRNQVEFFVDALAGYNADFVLFPEFFNAPLLRQFNQEGTSEAIRHMARFTEPIVEFMGKLAVSYNINIIAGSMPVYKDNELFNVSYLCHRDGSFDHQYKLHITPDERQYWGLNGGDKLQVFETDVAKIGILICYDVEFPELGRILADQGMQILFVPCWTDTKNAFLRVQRCAASRAIENECYVAVTGSVGNLPRVENIDIQYAQSTVFSPSDFAFPHDAVVAEATPNTEMTLIVDLDLVKLKRLHEKGAVRNLKDRRRELYRVDWVGPGEAKGDSAGESGPNQ